MLYTLDTPKIFVLLLLGVLLAWVVHVAAQRLVQRLMPETKWYLQRRPGAAALIDPFAAVAALLSPATVGWAPPVEWAGHRGSKRPIVTLLLAGPVGNLVAGLVLLEGFNAWAGAGALHGVLSAPGGFGDLLGNFEGFAKELNVVSLRHAAFGQTVLLVFGLQQLLVGVISLIPLPPLEGGRLLFLFTPKTVGWQKAEYNLAERNIGLIILLVGLISLGFVPPFAYLADVIARALALGISHL